jgi:hypothetical protein
MMSVEIEYVKVSELLNQVLKRRDLDPWPLLHPLSGNFVVKIRLLALVNK